MRTRVAHRLTKLIGLVLVFGATSTFAATLYPFYVIGGLANWSNMTTTVDQIPVNSPISRNVPLGTIEASTKDMGFRFGAGYSFTEQWSAEATYIYGPEQKASELKYGEGLIAENFSVDLNTKFSAKIMRFNPVFELSIIEPVSILAKAGVAKINVDMSLSFRVSGEDSDGRTGPLISTPDSIEDTKGFAAAGLKFNFLEGRCSVIGSFVKYFDTIEGLDQALELDFMFRY